MTKANKLRLAVSSANDSKYRTTPQRSLWLDGLIVDNFAGGGGASTGIERGAGRPVDIAINHDQDAIAMHAVNHPHTEHHCESVWVINPRVVTRGQRVRLAWFSPDCKHFSKAKGSTPVNKEIRGLAWVAVRWAATVKPDIIMLENVEEFLTWGPIVGDRPCPKRKGKTFKSFVRELERLGYQVEWKALRASDYGSPTIRKRLFMIARCDGQPIVWPTPTHANPELLNFKKLGLKKWRTAADDVIDWSLPCPSIFDRKKPLAENTLRRIARGIERYVLNNPKPFIVRIGQQGFGKNGMQYEIDKPLTTVTSKGEHCLVTPTLAKQVDVLVGDIHERLGEDHSSLASVFMAKHFGGNYTGPGAGINEPLSTVTAVDHNALVTAHLLHLRNGCDGRSVEQPIPTLTAGGGHVGLVRSFLIKYYGNEKDGCALDEPLHTVTAQDRFGLVTVHGEQYQIVDIGMRMLEPHELFRAQGFPADYIISHDADGKPIPKYKQVARCGNSVCPDLAEALVRANFHAEARQQLA